jgi:hypothetical protein
MAFSSFARAGNTLSARLHPENAHTPFPCTLSW